MPEINKRIITDDDNHPVAVEVDYADWLRIERLLGSLDDNGPPMTDLAGHAGRLDWPVDGLEYQQRMRREWE